MSKGYNMWPEHLLELHQLLRMYRNIYNDSEANRLVEIVAKKYEVLTGKPIETARNPRGAGRKDQYTEDKADEVRAVYRDCRSVRKTARETGVSTTYVYKAIKE